jgi:hypothetical protein
MGMGVFELFYGWSGKGEKIVAVGGRKNFGPFKS